MKAYYNEIEPTAAEWLRQLIKAGLIAPGDVDERSVEDVQPDDLKDYRQCHFFAGIGGWSYALRLAGWPDDRPIWTGSCPCQPFSCAGKGRGEADERHLWPEFYRLIKACRPPQVFGEQVASSEVVGTQLEASFIIAVQAGDYAKANKLAKRLAHGSLRWWRRWVDGVQTDLEAADYAFRFEVLGAHSVGAPHIRQRLYWLADAENMQLERATRPGNPDVAVRQAGPNCRSSTGRSGSACGLGDTKQPGLERHTRHGDDGGEPGRIEAAEDGYVATTGPWSDFDIVYCRDGKSRRIESGTFPLVDGLPGRVGLLMGYGNAIVPEVAAEFIKATVLI